MSNPQDLEGGCNTYIVLGLEMCDGYYEYVYSTKLKVHHISPTT
jgi:hypothetical protein